MKIKACLLLLILAMTAGCKSEPKFPDLAEDVKVQLMKDADACGLIALVKLSEAQIEGIWPIKTLGAEVKKDVDLEKTVNTRSDLWLWGEVIRFLKGKAEAKRLRLDISMKHLIAGRNNIVLEIPGSNIPNLLIGGEYLAMIKDPTFEHLYFNCIWRVDSDESKFIQQYLKKRNAPKKRRR